MVTDQGLIDETVEKKKLLRSSVSEHEWALPCVLLWYCSSTAHTDSKRNPKTHTWDIYGLWVHLKACERTISTQTHTEGASAIFIVGNLWGCGVQGNGGFRDDLLHSRGGRCRRQVSCLWWWLYWALGPADWGLWHSFLCGKHRIPWRAGHGTPPTGPAGPPQGLHTEQSEEQNQDDAVNAHRGATVAVPSSDLS